MKDACRHCILENKQKVLSSTSTVLFLEGRR